MRTLSSLGIGLGLVFGCLLLALLAEVYYLLWWKRRIASADVEDVHTNSAREFLDLFCCKKPSSLSSTALNPHEICTSARIADGSDETLQKPFGIGGEDGIETELMRLHNLSGPPRLLFTIKEETKEDLESEDGRSRKGSRGRSLSDVLMAAETPFLTPISSPPFLTPPLTPLDCYSQLGFNPLFESRKGDEANWIRASPPPKFKFLRDAEEKLYRKTLMDEALKVHRSKSPLSVPPPEVSNSPKADLKEQDGSFIRILMGKNQEKGQQQQQHHSSSSQVIPLTSSPSTIRNSKD